MYTYIHTHININVCVVCMYIQWPTNLLICLGFYFVFKILLFAKFFSFSSYFVLYYYNTIKFIFLKIETKDKCHFY